MPKALILPIFLQALTMYLDTIVSGKIIVHRNDQLTSTAGRKIGPQKRVIPLKIVLTSKINSKQIGTEMMY